MSCVWRRERGLESAASRARAGSLALSSWSLGWLLGLVSGLGLTSELPPPPPHPLPDPPLAHRKIMKNYVSAQGLDVSSVRFLFDGERVGADDTPTSLGMDDNDQLDVGEPLPRGRGAGRRRGSMMTYKTGCTHTIMRVAGSAISAMRKPQFGKGGAILRHANPPPPPPPSCRSRPTSPTHPFAPKCSSRPGAGDCVGGGALCVQS
jgi:hypothetical protein